MVASQRKTRQNTYHRASRHELLLLLLEASATSAGPSPVLSLAPKHSLRAASPSATLLPWFSFSFPFVGCYCNKIMPHKLRPPPFCPFPFPLLDGRGAKGCRARPSRQARARIGGSVVVVVM